VAQPFSFFASSPRNAEDLLAAELLALGATSVREHPSGVSFAGTLETGYRACLWSRVASRVMLPIAEFPAVRPEQVRAGTQAVAWEDHMDVDSTFAVSCSLWGSPIEHSHYGALLVKDGVADHFRERTFKRPSVDTEHPSIRLHVHLNRETARVSLDLSGESLHRRGYRMGQGAAPLKENVAAVMLLRARWPEIAAAGGAFLDPMCGSGTLVIEAALIALDVAPGLSRGAFGFLGWKQHDAALWRRVSDEAWARRKRSAGVPIAGYDADAAVVAKAKANALAAGLAGSVAFEARRLADCRPPRGGLCPPGLVAVNPPYGHRLGEAQSLVPLYELIGRVMREHFAGWRLALLTAEPRLSWSTGLRATRVNKLFNGAIPCEVTHFDMDAQRAEAERTQAARPPAPVPAPPPVPTPLAPPPPATAQASAPRGRAPRLDQTQPPARPEPRPARAPQPQPVDEAAAEAPPPSPYAVRKTERGLVERSEEEIAAEEKETLANRLRKNLRRLKTWARNEQVRCYRVYDADLPQYAVAVDLYEEKWAHVQEYAPPTLVDEERAARRMRDVAEAIPEALGVPAAGVFVKERRRQQGREQYERLDEKGERHEVREAGLRFLVNFTDYLDTGLFLDHRLTRAMIGEMAAGRVFLNLFCYTASATVHAAWGGAIRTVSVDTSNTYLAWATDNLALNGFTGERHQLVRADARDFLAHDKTRYGLVFIDPPTFSNSKGDRENFSVQRDHVGLIRAALDHLEPDGLIVFSNNFLKFKLDVEALGDLEVNDVSKQTIPRDFARHSRIHRCWVIRRPPAGSREWREKREQRESRERTRRPRRADGAQPDRGRAQRPR
jgi:23S rRNA (guanine2445-N2)-methyltransferase / 23S rRNA (guanine2069-N7)-methyltransferase